VPAFYGMQDTKTPVRVGLITVLANLAMSLTFLWTWPLHYKHAGLAFSVVAAEALNCLILTRLLEKRLGPPDWNAIGRSLARDLTGCALLAVTAFFAEAGARELALHAGLAPKLAQIAGVVAGLAAGIATYFASARLMKSPELTDFITAFRGRRRRTART
ncbi:MAG: polysaccharide biosynthesis C-terminal domain-containing protein, partial [Verrucomicrobia bacterium]|nr:polysaccharide biosynthesis C-terminal domain-containing protein [Verrucomicrobiota bacterium]